LGSAAVPALRSHGRHRPVDAVDWSTIGAVLAPAWAEAYPGELLEAYVRGVPIIATDRAAGALPAAAYRRIEPGDIHEMQHALATRSRATGAAPSGPTMTA